MLGRVQRVDADSLTPQVGDAVDVLIDEQLEAAGMHTGQYRNRHTLIDRVDAKRRKVRDKVKISAHKCLIVQHQTGPTRSGYR